MDELLVKKLSINAILPTRHHFGDAGYDLYSAEKVTINPQESGAIKTDIALKCPIGTYGRISSRSGLACKFDIEVGAGTVDANYRGNIQVLLRNLGKNDYKVEIGDRIAQIIFVKIKTPMVKLVEELDSTDRGSLGFGSTGEIAKLDGYNKARWPAAIKHIIQTILLQPDVTSDEKQHLRSMQRNNSNVWIKIMQHADEESGDVLQFELAKEEYERVISE